MAAVLPDVEAAGGRLRITDAAAELFLRNGYARTTLRDIAAAAGIKAGSIYYHFESKEALLLDILRRGIAVMEEAFEEARVAAGGDDPFARVRAHIRGHLSALFEHGPYTANHVSAFHVVPESVRVAVIPDRDRYERRWTELLEEMQAAGLLASDIPAGLSRLALFGAMNFAVEWFDPDRGNLDELVDVVARQYWSGVSAR